MLIFQLKSLFTIIISTPVVLLVSRHVWEFWNFRRTSTSRGEKYLAALLKNWNFQPIYFLGGRVGNDKNAKRRRKREFYSRFFGNFMTKTCVVQSHRKSSIDFLARCKIFVKMWTGYFGNKSVFVAFLTVSMSIIF